MSIQEEIRLNITIKWHNKPRVKAASVNSKGQTIIFILSIFKQGNYELLDIYFYFKGW